MTAIGIAMLIIGFAISSTERSNTTATQPSDGVDIGTRSTCKQFRSAPLDLAAGELTTEARQSITQIYFAGQWSAVPQISIASQDMQLAATIGGEDGSRELRDAWQRMDDACTTVGY